MQVKWRNIFSPLCLFLQVVHIEQIEAKEPVYVEIPENISKEVKEALEQLSITKLYHHQVTYLFLFFAVSHEHCLNFMFISK